MITPAHPELVAAFCAELAADPELAEVFAAMPTWRDDAIPYARQQAADLGLPVERWRQHVRRLTTLGLATYGTVWDNERGVSKGSSYWLTEQAAHLRRTLESEAA